MVNTIKLYNEVVVLSHTETDSYSQVLTLTKVVQHLEHCKHYKPGPKIGTQVKKQQQTILIAWDVNNKNLKQKKTG